MAQVAAWPARSVHLRFIRGSLLGVRSIIRTSTQRPLEISQRAMVTAAAGGGEAAPVQAPPPEQQQRPSQHADQQQARQQNATQQHAKQQQQQPRTRPTQGQLVERCMIRGGPPTIDIGANLIDRSFDKDRAAVLEREGQAGVQACIVTGTCVRTAQAAAELCASPLGRLHGLYFTAGCHPHNAKSCNEDSLSALRQLAGSERCVAIGECGLDFNRMFSPQEVQERWFATQIELAEELQLQLFLHCRDAGQRFAEILRAHRRSVPGVAHCFTGSREELELCLELGLHIGITGWICDDRPDRGAAQLAALLPLIPADRLLIETDCPYLTPRTIQPSKARPQRCEPALLPHVLAAVAAARGETVEQVAAITTANARRLFRLPDA